MGAVRCFMIEHTGECLRYLRRFSLGRVCQGGPAYCNAQAFLDRSPTPMTAPIDGQARIDGTLTWPKDDPRWPTICERCGGDFLADDYWQVFILELYRRTDGQPGEYSTHCSADLFPGATKAPAGAMWFCDWMGWQGPDGRTLSVQLPGRYEWCIDGPSKSGGHWTRRGTPPDVVASPSILSPDYHGFLGGGAGDQPGFLVEC